MIYLDEAATSKPKKEVIKVVNTMLESNWTNPSSIYSNGKIARQIIEDSRINIANKINAKPEEIVFCPSSSAANTLAVLGYLKRNRVNSFVTTNIEHDSILNIEMPIWVKRNIERCDKNGFLSPEQFEKYNNCLISVMGANNEIGSIQPIQEITNVVKRNNCIVHTDLTQYIPHKPVDVQGLGVDMATFSGHKIGGLKGCAVLFLKDGIDLEPLIYGHQEFGLVGGTENTLAISAMSEAMKFLDYSKEEEIEHLRNYAIDRFTSLKDTYLVGNKNNRLSNNLNICFRGIEANGLIYYLDLHGICCSSGSACNSMVYKPSHVLKALELPNEDVYCCIRFTINTDTTYEDIDRTFHYIHSYISMVGGNKQ